MNRPARYNDIDFKPPKSVAQLAGKGLELRQRHGRGGTSIGVARARDLKNRQNLSPETIERMVSYFARHEVDKRAKDFGNDDDPSAGYVAWLLWGGDEGRDWANRIADEMEAVDSDENDQS